MLSHHVAVYDYLVKTFPDAEVFIGTSDKVDDKSPFNYKEKQMIALSQGIDPNKVYLHHSHMYTPFINNLIMIML